MGIPGMQRSLALIALTLVLTFRITSPGAAEETPVDIVEGIALPEIEGDFPSAVRGSPQNTERSTSGLEFIRGSNPPVYYGLKARVYIIPICVIHNTTDQVDNDWIEFTTYEIDIGPDRIAGEDDAVLGVDYVQWAYMQQGIFERSKGPEVVVMSTGKGCEEDLVFASRRTEGERVVHAEDKDRQISRAARPFWTSNYQYHGFWKKIACDSEWNQSCKSSAVMRLDQLDDFHRPTEMQVCNLSFRESHFGGWEAHYSFEPIITDRSEARPAGYVIGYHIGVRANGNENPLNRIGARVDITNLGMSFVRKNVSPENFAALRCDPTRPANRSSRRNVAGARAPMQCVDSDGAGYYCGETPRSGRTAPGGFPIYTFP